MLNYKFYGLKKKEEEKQNVQGEKQKKISKI